MKRKTEGVALLEAVDETPFIALVDDDAHSANLLIRALTAQGAPRVRPLFGDAEGIESLLAMIGDVENTWPDIVVIDLKAHSGANADFLAQYHPLLRQKGIPVAVMAAPTGRDGRQDLLDSGASAVFFRQAEREAYLNEAAAIVSFWARQQRLDAVGM
ncbi:MAG: response regulator transcription factor [Devosia sp.]|uniref:hypothetical protein n=1 Tax=Devosia sp. TaxID=1871048 RepID=UPI0024CB6D48|nr:hypothetical protein [Devosia sp.]UYO01067.1 MAG: response regulator transcription factor [Devosia sp.]